MGEIVETLDRQLQGNSGVLNSEPTVSEEKKEIENIDSLHDSAIPASSESVDKISEENTKSEETKKEEIEKQSEESSEVLNKNTETNIASDCKDTKICEIESQNSQNQDQDTEQSSQSPSNNQTLKNSEEKKTSSIKKDSTIQIKSKRKLS